MAIPLVMAAYMSFFADGVIVFPPSGYTFDWYARLAEFPNFASGLATSLKIALFSTAGSILIGVPASIALVRYRFFGRAGLNVLLLAPLSVPGVVIGLGIYIQTVEIDRISGVSAIGSPVVLVLAHLLITTPWVIRLCIANLMHLDRSIEEAAANLGATPLKVLLRITLPMMKQGVVAAALFSFIVSFENIELTLFLISPGTITFPISVLQYLEYRYDPLAAAVVVTQTLVIGALLLAIDRYVKLSSVVS